MQNKIFKIIISVLLIVLVGLLIYYFYFCKKNEPIIHDETNKAIIENKSYDFEACYKRDYNDMVKKYGDGNFMFYWAEAKMDRNVNDESFSDTCKVVEVVTLFQVKDESICYQYTHTEGNYNSLDAVIDTFYGRWSDCLDIKLENITMTLKDAIKHFKNIDNREGYGNYIVMRCPLYPPFPSNPYWIFGDDKYFLVLDENGNYFKR